MALLGWLVALGVGFLPDEITVRVIANEVVPLTGLLLAAFSLLLVHDVAAADALDHVIDQQGEMSDGTAGKGWKWCSEDDIFWGIFLGRVFYFRLSWYNLIQLQGW